MVICLPLIIPNIRVQFCSGLTMENTYCDLCLNSFQFESQYNEHICSPELMCTICSDVVKIEEMKHHLVINHPHQFLSPNHAFQDWFLAIIPPMTLSLPLSKRHLCPKSALPLHPPQKTKEGHLTTPSKSLCYPLLPKLFCIF